MSESDYTARILAMERRIEQLQILFDALTIRLATIEQNLIQNWSNAR